MLRGGVRFCRWSVTPLSLGFPGSVGDAGAMTLQGNNFSQLLPFSDGDLCRMDLPEPTTSVGTRTDYSVGPYDYPTCAARHLMA
jgi:hypothetical protein